MTRYIDGDDIHAGLEERPEIQKGDPVVAEAVALDRLCFDAVDLHVIALAGQDCCIGLGGRGLKGE